MPAERPHTEANIWEALLLLAKTLSSHGDPVPQAAIAWEPEPTVWLGDLPDPLPPAALGIRWDAPTAPLTGAWAGPAHKFSLHWYQTGTLDAATRHFLDQYLPYALLHREAHVQGRAMAISHFAQSLDGKIATGSGDSRWIGNDENLIHAHRMRALCDGIMIGTRTLQSDQPSLTVRLVPGENPRRVVITSSARDFSSLFAACPEPVLVIGTGERVLGQNLEYQQLDAPEGRIACHDILRCLYERGICSVYIEGGAETTSNFLRERALDVVQLHLSPLLFGSGISGIRLPGIEEVREAVAFEPFTFLTVGDTVMFVGEPRPHA
ncbi:MAG: RibD family protein [Bacteroidetes bacterium]|nr:MAG: RibD family protein [Bacteroidota bacterium]